MAEEMGEDEKVDTERVFGGGCQWGACKRGRMKDSLWGIRQNKGRRSLALEMRVRRV